MPISKRTRIMIFRRDDYTCTYCGAINVPLHLDHVIPRSIGGSDDPANLTTACVACNLGKGSLLIMPADRHREREEFFEYLAATEAGYHLWQEGIESDAIPAGMLIDPLADPADVAWLTGHCGGTAQ